MLTLLARQDAEKGLENTENLVVILYEPLRHVSELVRLLEEMERATPERHKDAWKLRSALEQLKTLEEEMAKKRQEGGQLVRLFRRVSPRISIEPASPQLAHNRSGLIAQVRVSLVAVLCDCN